MKRAVSNWAILIPIAIALWAQILLSGVDYVNGRSWWFVRLVAPVPYKDVQILDVNQQNGWINIRANFIKTSCFKDSFKPVGFQAGAVEALTWKDGDGRPDDESREPGRQTITGKIFVGGQDFDYIEIRTRHICNGELEIVDGVTTVRGGVVVDKVFARFDPDVIVTPDAPVSGHEAFIGPKGGY